MVPAELAVLLLALALVALVIARNSLAAGPKLIVLMLALAAVIAAVLHHAMPLW